ncbi:hypothetical protein PLICRDRAFT_27113 [Plicaturopsis crispa FD-325 SS-3]|nr:hypothetical protein PLICRDRAFT_27113 [Plicaturopsis crispa FD-325 SS-3]
MTSSRGAHSSQPLATAVRSTFDRRRQKVLKILSEKQVDWEKLVPVCPSTAHSECSTLVDFPIEAHQIFDSRSTSPDSRYISSPGSNESLEVARVIDPEDRAWGSPPASHADKKRLRALFSLHDKSKCVSGPSEKGLVPQDLDQEDRAWM